MKFRMVKIQDVLDIPRIDEVLYSLELDDLTQQEIKVYLSVATLVGIYQEDTLIGFFSVEALSQDLVEIHAYIPPQFRSLSIKALRGFKRLILEGTPFKKIQTSVVENFNYIIRLLKMLGFKVTHISDSVVQKDGKPLSITYMVTTEGD